MSKPTQKYYLKATVEHRHGSSGESVLVVLEGSGYTGSGNAYSLSSAFDAAYRDLMSKLSTDIFTEERL